MIKGRGASLPAPLSPAAAKTPPCLFPLPPLQYLIMPVENILRYLSDATDKEKEQVKKAYTFAEQAHSGQKRYSGEPYMNHLASVGEIIASMGMGVRTVTAGLLHDTIEDTEVTPEDIKREFGEEILFLVDGVTKLSSVRYYGTDRHNESLRKLFVATSQDIRVLIIKLSDRLHNMQTLCHIPPEKQIRIARETLEIYVPVAHRLGMGKIRKELEDLCFIYVYPEEYQKTKQLLESKTGKSQDILEKERKILQKKLADSKLLDFNTSFRIKGLFSLYHKLKRKGWDINSVYDLLAMRVIVSNVEDCYKTLGIIHELWRPLPGRMKDYIAFPKPNGYKSIHTTVTTKNGIIMEIQIRTRKMHHEAEFGVASHIIYKDTTTGTQSASSKFVNLIPSLFKPFTMRSTTNTNLAAAEAKSTADHRSKIPRWISQIGQTYTDKTKFSTAEFIEDTKRDFFSNRIFVFTPAGDVVDLPVGATPIDFAYAIHSEIGNHTAGAWINKKLVQLDTELKNGDIVEIDTKKSAKPTNKWLIVAKTALARRHIKTALDNEPV